MAENLPLGFDHERSVSLEEHIETMIQLVEQNLVKEGFDPQIVSLQMSFILARAAANRAPKELPMPPSAAPAPAA